MQSEGSVVDSVRVVRHRVGNWARAWSVERRIHWVLRVGAAMCFIGHGAFGIITKAAWIPYFGVVGIPAEWAYRLMPVVGTVDIVAGLVVLFSPRPVVLLYMAVWALWTALLRPLSGDNAWETLERAGNYGVPFAFLVLAGGREALRDWLARVEPWRMPGRTSDRVARVLQLTTATLLVGHGALGALTSKPLLAAHYGVIGLPVEAAPLIGWFEVALAAVVMLHPTALLLAFVALWKITTELLFPITGAPIWEFIERGGSYAAPIALAVLLHYRKSAEANVQGVLQ